MHNGPYSEGKAAKVMGYQNMNPYREIIHSGNHGRFAQRGGDAASILYEYANDYDSGYVEIRIAFIAPLNTPPVKGIYNAFR